MRKLVALATIATMVLTCSVQAAAYYGGTATVTDPYVPAVGNAAGGAIGGGTAAAPAGTLSSSVINSALLAATMTEDGETLTVNLQNAGVINGPSFKSLVSKGVAAGFEEGVTNVEFEFDNISNRSVVSRITMSAYVANQLNNGFDTRITFDGPTVDSISDMIMDQFGKRALVASMGQKGNLPDTITVAVYFGSANLPETPYAYVVYGNTAYQVPVAVDAQGYAYITTSVGGEIVIVDGSLTPELA